MMKCKHSGRILLLLCAALLLGGCGAANRHPTDAPDVIPSSTQEIKPTFMENREPVGETGNLWYIPNPCVERFEYAEISMLGEDLLVYANMVDADTGNRLFMERISLRDGTSVAQKSFACGYVTLQSGESAVGLCDIEQRKVTVFNDLLEETASYHVQLGQENTDAFESWFLSRDLQELYIAGIDHGLTRLHLATGEKTALLTDTENLYAQSHLPESLTLTYTDLVTQRKQCTYLNLENGELASVPGSVNTLSAGRVGDIWLLQNGSEWGRYELVRSGEAGTLWWQGSRLDLLSPNAQLLAVDEDAREHSIYDTQGNLLSRFVLPDGLYAARTFLWSEAWNGYFFLAYGEGVPSKLMFWDMTVPSEGEKLQILSEEEMSGYSADPALYQRAEALGAQYGVEIRIADQCQLEYLPYYSSSEVYGSQWISSALDLLEAGLAAYPQGFFDQLLFDTIEKIQIELVGNLTPSADSGVLSAGAFAQRNPDYYLMVFDVYSMGAGTFHHEITHVMDARLAWDAALREDALFSEETWVSMNPAGFHYAFSYGEVPEDVIAGSGSGYFVWEYSMTYPTEDRATMMETAITEDFLNREHWNGLLDKLDYYSRCIRDCMDTTGWPEVTAWEAVLQS